MKYLFVILLVWSAVGIAQDSPMQAAPGEPPPPQGWGQSQPDGGLHLPKRKPKKKYELKMGPADSKPAPTPEQHK
jgi:hypothetical protein